MPKPDIKTINTRLARTISRQLNIRNRERLLTQFEIAKETLLSKVASHPVSLELNSEGLMFGFFGFLAGDDPVSDLISFLDSFISINYIGSNNLKSRVIVTLPAKQDLRDQGLSLTWEPGKSWVEAVETGIDNYARFLPIENQGRSEVGIQAKGDVGKYIYRPRPYLSEILREFRTDLVRFIR